jgi:hypothetical protein
MLKTSIVAKILGPIIILWFALAFWYVEAGNFDARAISGSYRNSHNDITFVMKADHTFCDSEGGSKQVHGTWHVFGEGHIEFSPTFQTLIAGAESGDDGTVVGQIENNFGFVSITIGTQPNGTESRVLKFYKRLFE